MINYHYFETVSSTQKYAKKNARDFDLSQMTCIYTSAQTEGLGTRGKKWFSPRCGNIYATFVFSAPTTLKHFHNLAQILSLSVATVLKKYSLKPTLRWPNDIMLSGKKVGGVLCELSTSEKSTTAFLGLGLNVNMENDDLSLIDQPATSLSLELNSRQSEKEVLCHIGEQFLVDLETYENDGFAPFYDHYEKLMQYIGAPITFTESGEKHRGHVKSIHPDGRLNVILPNGNVVPISSGTINNSD